MMFTDGGFTPLPLLLSLPKDFIGEGDHKIPCSTWYLDNVAHHKQEKQSSIKCSRLHFPRNKVQTNNGRSFSSRVLCKRENVYLLTARKG